jgi:hypothetical protein
MINNNPCVEDIIDLATECGYEQRHPYASYTLFFISPATTVPPIFINVYPTTRSIMTQLHHPKNKKGKTNALWRSSAYEDLEDLRTFFLNPRQHTGKGYRNAKHAVRGCVHCGEMKQRTEFSNNQWMRKGPDENKCKACVQDILEKKYNSNSIQQEGNTTTTVPTLTAEALEQHNRGNPTTSNRSNHKNQKKTHLRVHNNNIMERRQFNCPICPLKGRGDSVFFKRVPVYKPFVKCPKCKLVTQGKCSRIMPVPRDQERGYGFFVCPKCKDTWGSSRAVANVGQECFACAERTGTGGTMVKPFRLEVIHKKRNSHGGRSRRSPKNVIPEDQPEEGEYTVVDQQRHFAGANDALLSKGGSTTDYINSFDANNEIDNKAQTTTVKQKNPRIPEGYRHKCDGCVQGLCRRRLPPKSQVHDVSDGDTISTRSSIVTNSSVNKTEFVDRDEDFSGFILDDENDDENQNNVSIDSWVQV